MRKRSQERLATSLCAGWRISFRKKERPTFYVRKRIEWEKHIEELAAEGPEAFQKM
jgi:hypothetical protein